MYVSSGLKFTEDYLFHKNKPHSIWKLNNISFNMLRSFFFQYALDNLSTDLKTVLKLEKKRFTDHDSRPAYKQTSDKATNVKWVSRTHL